MNKKSWILLFITTWWTMLFFWALFTARAMEMITAGVAALICAIIFTRYES